LGLGAKESNFLELGSWRGYTPRWLEGNSFRKALSGKLLQEDDLLLQEVNLKLLSFYPKFKLWNL
jgi:hypothetical protein